LVSTTLAEYDDLLVQISEETWPDVVNRVKEIDVTLEEHSSASSGALVMPELAENSTMGPPTAATSNEPHQGTSVSG
jgi:hypothetical protein